MRVVDDDGFLVPVVHLPPHPQLLARVEPEERHRPVDVVHRYPPDRAVRARRTRDDPARLVRVVPAGMRDDLVEDLATDGQHGSLAYKDPFMIDSSSDSCNTPRYSYVVSCRTRAEVGSRMTASSSSSSRSVSSRTS